MIRERLEAGAQLPQVLSEHGSAKAWWPAVQLYMDKVRKDNLRFLTAAVAWNLLVSVVPIAIGILALTGLVFHGSSQQQEIVRFTSRAFQGVMKPPYLEKLVTITLGHSVILAATAVLGVIWAAEQVGFALACAFEAMFEVAPRKFVWEKLLHVLMFLVFVVLMLMIVATTVARSVIDQHLSHASTAASLLQFPLTTLVSLLMAFVLFAVIYFAYPNVHLNIRVRHVWTGAAAAAVLFQILTFIWPLYVESLSKYGGILFPILVLVLWIYFFSMILLMGGELVAILSIRYAEEHGIEVGPKPDGTVPGHMTMRDESKGRLGGASRKASR
jgi:membrane protein